MSNAARLLLPRYLLPVRPARTVREHWAVRVVGERIDAVLPQSEALARYPDDERVPLERHLLMPGMMNMHTHSPMVLLRGYADDLPLKDWLEQHIWPAEARWVDAEFVRQGAELAIAEMLRGGTTCFSEQYFFPDEIAAAARSAGIRAVVGVPVIDVATRWASGVTDCLARAEALAADWAGDSLVRVALAPHALYTVDDDGLAAVARMSAERDLPVSMHVLEAAWEIRHSEQQYGEGALRRLQRVGLLDERFMAVHMVHLGEDDIERLAQRGVHVVHCPESNLKLSSGVSPVADLLGAGVNLGLGTDGAAANNDLDLLGELRTAALLAKGVSGDPSVLDAWQALELVTINAARALGADSELGSVEPGKLADLAALDLSWPETQPLHHVHSQVVYAASRRQFTDVWVAGRRLLSGGELTTLDLDAVLARAQEWSERMLEEAA
ncbi:MAG: TRZ/ATZ family hydrolase [Gammaproteobacteria bacterium]